MYFALLSLLVQHSVTLKVTDLQPRNVNSIRHENFAAFWKQSDSPWLVHTDSTSIYAHLLSDNERADLLLIEDCGHVISFDYVFAEQLLVWTEASQEQSYSPKQPASVNFYQSGSGKAWRFDIPDSGSIKSIAVDWVVHNIYWLDGKRNVVNVCGFDGKDCAPIIFEGLSVSKSAQILLVDSPRNRLYFNNNHLIESISLDGRNRTVAHATQGRMLMGIALDAAERRIFFGTKSAVPKSSVDSYIQVVSMDGVGKGAPVVYPQIDHADPLLYFNQTVFWQDGNGKLWSLPFPHPANVKPRPHLSVGEPINIMIVSNSLQPKLTDPCQNTACSHLCLRSEEAPFFRCACPTGITFKKTGTDTRSTTQCNRDPEHLMVLGKSDDLPRISLDTPDRQPVKIVDFDGAESKRCRATAIDPINKVIYYTTDYVRYPTRGVQINSCNIDGSENKVLLSSGLATIEGMTLDYINQILYWTDADLLHIESADLRCRCDLAGCHESICRKIVVQMEERDRPRAIVVGGGYIFWSDWSDVNPRIERANQDGDNRKPIVTTDIVWPNGLTISPDYRTLYFLEAFKGGKRIEQVDIEGQHRQVIFKMDSNKWKAMFLWTINMFENKLYLWGSNDAIKVLEQTERENTGRQQASNWTAHDFSSINNGYMIATADLTTPETVKETGCKYITLPQPDGHNDCGCPETFHDHSGKFKPVYAEDGKTVTCEAPHEQIIYVTIGGGEGMNGDVINTLELTSLKLQKIKSLDHQDGSSPPSVDYHYQEGLIFYFETDKRTAVRSLYRFQLDGRAAAEVITDVGLTDAIALTVDWVGDSIYWTNRYPGKIEQIGIDGRNRRTVSTDCKQPHAIRVDPLAGYIFWSNWEGNKALTRSDMSNNNAFALLRTGEKSGIERIQSIALDYDRRLIYVLDVDTNVVFELGYDHDSEEKPRAFLTQTTQTWVISFYDRKLYWVEESSKSTLKQKNTETGSEGVVKDNMAKVTDMIVYAPQTGWGYCHVDKKISNQKCPGICITEPSAEAHHFEHSCVCPTHYQKFSDKVQGQFCHFSRSFLLYAQARQVTRLITDMVKEENPDEPEGAEQVLSIHQIQNARAISWHSNNTNNNRFYWIDFDKHKIYSMEEEGNRRQALLPDTRQVPTFARDFAIYDVGDLIFWTTKDTQSAPRICFAHLTADGVGRDPACFPSEPDVTPDKIVIDQASGRIIFSNDCSVTGKSETCKLLYSSLINGEHPCPILEASPPVTAIAIGVDSSQKNIEIYWSDGRKIWFQKMNISSNSFRCKIGGHHSIYFDPKKGEQYRIEGIAVTEDHVYWIGLKNQQYQSGFLLQGERHGDPGTRPADPQRIRSNLENLSAIHMVNLTRSLEDRRDACQQKECSHICTGSTHESDGNLDVECTCPAGLVLDEEHGCANDHCREDEFSCRDASLRCISKKFQCDGNDDCNDGSDESPEVCSKKTCAGSEFNCGDGSCIERTGRCNGQQDCHDGRDEDNCATICDPDTQFQCFSERECISKSAKCDQKPDCSDGSDEKDCQTTPTQALPIIDTSKVIWYAVGVSVVAVFLILVCIVIFNRRSPCERSPPPQAQPANINIAIYNTLGQEMSTVQSGGTSSSSIKSRVFVSDKPLLAPHPSPSSTLKNSAKASSKKRKKRTRQRAANNGPPAYDSDTTFERGSATGDSNPPMFGATNDCAGVNRYGSSRFPLLRRSQSPDGTVTSYAPPHPAPCPSPVSALISDKE